MAFLDRLEGHWFRDSEDEVRWSQDSRTHIRIPARVGRALVKSFLAFLKTTYNIICSFAFKRSIFRNWYKFTYTALLAPCIPLSIALGASDHHTSATLAVGFLGLVSASGLFRHGSELFVLSSAVQPWVRLAWSFTIEAFSIDVEIAILALCRGRLDLVQGYVVGKVVSTLLLSLGVSFIASGLRRGESRYSETAASTLCGLLLAATAAIGVLAFMATISPPSAPLVSRAASLVLLCVFFIYVIFRRRTHAILFDNDEPESTVYDQTTENDRSDEHDWATAVVLMFLAIVLAFFCGRSMLGKINETKLMHETFLGYLTLPFISNLVDLPKSYVLGAQDNMDTALEVAAGTSVQTALYVGPVLVIVGWIRDEQLGHNLNIFPYFSLFASVWVFSFLVSQGKSNYLSGVQCIGLYLIQSHAMYLYTRT